MDLEKAKELLAKSQGEHVYDMFVPSLKKTFQFKSMNIGQMKTLAKVSVMSETNFTNYQLLKMSLLESLCMSKDFSIESLTDIDFISLTAQLKTNNIFSPINMKLVCKHIVSEKYVDEADGLEKIKKAYCNNEILFDINFQYIMDKCANFGFKTIIFEKEFEGIKYKFELSQPSMLDTISFQSYLEIIEKDERTKDKLVQVTYSNSPIQYVKKIFLNDEEITDYTKKSFIDKIILFESFIKYGVLHTTDGLIAKVNKEFVNGANSVFHPITCPKCGDVKEGVVTFDSFFIP